MKCPRCQADNRDGARFCRECGATFAAVCPSWLYRRMGKRQQAEEHLTTAATMYQEMGMQFWLEKVEAEQKT